MSPFQEWVLRWIFRDLVRQGGHVHRIRRIYSLVRECCVEEFNEDNPATMDSFLDEQFRATQANKPSTIPVLMVGDKC